MTRVFVYLIYSINKMDNNIVDIQQEFDVKQFNIEFDAMKAKITAENEIKDKQILQELENKENKQKIPVYLQSPEVILFSIKNTWFNIFDDYTKFGLSLKLIDVDDRLFYIGLTFIFFALTLYALYVLFDFEEVPNTNKIIENHYYHEQKLNHPNFFGYRTTS